MISTTQTNIAARMMAAGVVIASSNVKNIVKPLWLNPRPSL
jgi:hypothetical protein